MAPVVPAAGGTMVVAGTVVGDVGGNGSVVVVGGGLVVVVVVDGNVVVVVVEAETVKVPLAVTPPTDATKADVPGTVPARHVVATPDALEIAKAVSAFVPVAVKSTRTPSSG